MSDEAPAAIVEESGRFRHRIGVACILAGVLCTVLLFVVKIPEGNREPLLLAIGLLLGWGSSVVNSEFGSSPAGRRAANAGVRSPQERG